MKISDFNYSYPDELVAQKPLPSRGDSRMMVANRATGSFEHSHFKLLPSFLRKGDLLVVNDSKVVPARIFGTRASGEKIELLVVEPCKDEKHVWKCLLKRARRVRHGEKFFFGMQATAKALGREDIFLLVEFKGNSLSLAMKHHGVPPLPPYIEREGFDAYSEEDVTRYQTVYANELGSAAAPTAGLHFNEEMFNALSEKGIGIAKITLHVGIDTFQPIRVDELSSHKMHGERVSISKETAEAISATKKNGGRVIAIGTTAVRALESASFPTRYGNWTTDLFITPGFEFKVVDAMLTNFHQPKSTLLVLVSAFAGREFILKCYEDAIKERYRLFSYGDCMLIL